MKKPYQRVGFSGNEFPDRMILSKLDDDDLFPACQASSSIMKLCDNEFFRKRFQQKYPNLTKLTNLTNPENIGWKEFYLRWTYFVAVLKERFNINYKTSKHYGIESPETLYLRMKAEKEERKNDEWYQQFKKRNKESYEQRQRETDVTIDQNNTDNPDVLLGQDISRKGWFDDFSTSNVKFL